MGSDSWNDSKVEFYNGNEDDYIYVSEYFDTRKNRASIFGAEMMVIENL